MEIQHRLALAIREAEAAGLLQVTFQMAIQAGHEPLLIQAAAQAVVAFEAMATIPLMLRRQKAVKILTTCKPQTVFLAA
jgi:hypothetical protein